MADISTTLASTESWDPSVPEDAQGLIAPGQEELAKEFFGDSPEPSETATEEQPLIGGKFQTQDDLLKAYQELERKQSQQTSSTPDPQGYTAEQALQVYGEDIVNKVTEAGLDMADLMWQADQGGDISEHYDALAQAVGVPRNVVENYVAKNRADGAGRSETQGFTAADEAEIMGAFGGQEGFHQLSQWGAQNMTETEKAEYNRAVDSGNKDAVMWALRALQAKQSQTSAPTSEPKLIRGQAPVEERRSFKSTSEVLEAMNKRDSRGRKLYDVDTEYQRKFAELLANSDVFM